jgi:hypothetical protein
VNTRPSPDEARALLSDAVKASGAVVEATQRPAWIDAVMASVVGIACGLAVRHSPGELIAAAVILTLMVSAVIVVEMRSVRRRGRILDERSLGAHALYYAAFYLPLTILSALRAPDDWWPWYSIGVGLIIACLGFAYLRLGERYQSRRLAKGDYGRHDLV